MSGIFISYRHEDSQQLAGRLYDRLAERFGKERVFRDIDAIDPGAKFAQVIAERIGDCDARENRAFYRLGQESIA